MHPNSKPSEQVALLDSIAPASLATGAATTGWISVASFQKLLVLIQTGVLGASATIDAKLQQATASAGTGAKDITGTAITQVVKASGDGKQVAINFDTSQLDVEGGFDYVQLSVTVGTAASLASAVVLGFSPRFGPASASNNATVVQIVN